MPTRKNIQEYEMLVNPNDDFKIDYQKILNVTAEEVKATRDWRGRIAVTASTPV